jgi:hypothetical protein
MRKENNMPQYKLKVTHIIAAEGTVVVEAENENQAIQQAEGLVTEDPLHAWTAITCLFYKYLNSFLQFEKAWEPTEGFSLETRTTEIEEMFKDSESEGQGTA